MRLPKFNWKNILLVVAIVAAIFRIKPVKKAVTGED